MDEAHRRAMEVHGKMDPDMKKFHEEMMEAHKDLSLEDAEKMHKMVEQFHHPHGINSGHETFVKKIDEMDEKLNKIMIALKVE
ncbi:MAG: hypothetical protein KAH57_05245 [Thermoplasmata archaeon]|nr:hypothetical protein [Thermoplasmata archaeon]